MLRVVRWIRVPWRLAAEELLAALQATLARHGSPAWSVGAVMLCALGAWFIYVPAHELLHAAGCLLASGRVEEVRIARLYGGGWLERLLPFVRAGGHGAGRLTKFDTGGSDLIYLMTDFAPFLLTVVAAVPLLRAARRHRSPILFGAGAVLIMAPLVCLTGDFYEMGAILVGAVLERWAGGAPSVDAAALRSDDLPALLAEFGGRFPRHRAAGAVAVAAAAATGFLLACATLSLGRWWADLRAFGTRT